MTDSDNLTSPLDSQLLLRSQDDETLSSIQTHTIGRSGERFVYLRDIQDVFSGAVYLLDNRGERVFFEIIKKVNGYEL